VLLILLTKKAADVIGTGTYPMTWRQLEDVVELMMPPPCSLKLLAVTSRTARNWARVARGLEASEMV
jgi:hypothetical protein